MINTVRNILIFSVWLQGISLLKAQSPQKQKDTLITKTLDPVFVNTYFKNAAPKFIGEVVGMNNGQFHKF